MAEGMSAEPEGTATAVGHDMDDDGEGLPEEALAELAAVAEAQAELEQTGAGGEPAAVREAQEALEAQRAETREAVQRYRQAVLAAEPAIPQELVTGESLAELELSLDSARRAVAQIREQLSLEQASAGAAGFPVGAPQRGGSAGVAISATEKIALGLGERTRAS